MFSYVPNSPAVRSSTSNKPPLYGTAFFRQPSTSSLESTFEFVREDVFSKSVDLTETNSAGDFTSDLHKSVQVLPSTSGRYQIYRDSINSPKQNVTRMSVANETSFKFNISNPNRPKVESGKVKKSPDSKKIHVTKGKPKVDRKYSGSVSTKNPPASTAASCEQDFECSCKQYHSHVFLNDSINMDMIRQEEQRVKAVNDSHKSSLYLAEGTDDARNIFWTPALSFHSYKHGDSRVDFPSLWPSRKELQEHLQNSGVLSTVLRGAVFELGLQAIVCGPIHLLKCLIQLCLIRVDQQFENGSSMLHIACLSRNMESVQYLTQIGISPKIRDKHGYTADQVTFCPKIKRLLPPKYTQKDNSGTVNRSMLQPSLQDKDNIFSLAKNPKNFDDIQKKLQMFDFNVNTECDRNGDFLLHVACREGLCQLPLIMALIKIQMADVELCNGQGMTSLMLSAITGNSVLCDVLMCLFGASPNKSNPNNGRFALHYAVEGNHRKTVECLIRRGADVNVEDHDGRRPDDVPACIGPDDCREVINFNRLKRLETLSQGVMKGNLGYHELQYTDMYVVNDDGYTLIMVAAIHDQTLILKKLLATNKTTINAQHSKTGMTALAIAAQKGNANCVRALLVNGANPCIGDMESYLPIHHAVYHNHEVVVEIILEFFPAAFIGLYKAIRMSKKSSIHMRLKSAWDKRQEEIVTPTLLACSFNGDADQLYVLLDEGDCINPKSGSGSWPLYLAVENGHLDVVRLLHQKGGDIKKRHGTTGATVLHVASNMGHYHIIEYLVQFCKTLGEDNQYTTNGLRRKLDVNTIDSDNKTALQIAADKGFSKIVRLLINNGATTALLDSQGSLFTATEYEGVRILIDSQRERHTKNIMKLLTEKSKKSLPLLQKIWLPRFDHNLRTKQGDTPLMVACQTGNLQVVMFLLESAVYSTSPVEDNSDDDSDADSGVLDHTWAIRRQKQLFKSDEGEELSQISFNFNQSLDVNNGVTGGGLTASGELTQSLEPRNEIQILENTGNNKTLQVLLRDVDKPKGLQIFQDSTISHLCAVNLFTGYSLLHYIVQKGDNLPLIRVILSADCSCLNIQDNNGLTPLHLASQTGRRKSIDLLLSYEGIDLNLRSLQGHLPEEMTNNKNIVKSIQKSRIDQTGLLTDLNTAIFDSFPIMDAQQFSLTMKPPATPEDESPSASKPPSIVGSTINFDKLHTRYEALKKEGKSRENSFEK